MGVQKDSSIYILDVERTGEWATALYRKHGDKLKKVACLNDDSQVLALQDPIDNHINVFLSREIEKITTPFWGEDIEKKLKDSDILMVLDDKIYQDGIKPILEEDDPLVKHVNVVFFIKHPILKFTYKLR